MNSRSGIKRGASEDGPEPKRSCNAEAPKPEESTEEEEVEEKKEEVFKSTEETQSSKEDTNTDHSDGTANIVMSDVTVEACKFFILRAFQNNVNRREAAVLLNRLAGTPFAHDPDVLCCALSSDLDPQRVFFDVGTPLVLQEDHAFLARAFEATASIDQAKELWALLDDATRQVPSVAFAALSRGLPFSNLPVTVKNNRACLLEGIKKDLLLWEHLPQDCQSDTEFALAARDNENTRFFEVLRTVTDKDTLWLEWACKFPERTDLYYDWILFETGVPTHIAADGELMRKVINTHPGLVILLAPSLTGNKEYVTSILKDHPGALYSFRRETYNQFPELFSFPAIKRCLTTGARLCDLEKKMPDQCCNNHEFVLEWVSMGGDVNERVAPSILGDQEIFLTAAKSSAATPGFDCNRLNSFRVMSPTLKKNKEFILKLCEVTGAGYFIDFIDRSFAEDEEILMAACATSAKFCVYTERDWASLHHNEEIYKEFQNTVKRKFSDFEGFFKGILCGTSADSSSALRMLDQGPDAGIKRHIASYLDFPVGTKQVVHLVKAARNLLVGKLAPYDPDPGEQICRLVFQ